jgi:hypothetical protein
MNSHVQWTPLRPYTPLRSEAPDFSQLRWPDSAGGANRPSLIETQAAFAEIGAIEPRLVPHVRAPSDDDARDPQWRPFDATLDQVEEHVSRVDYGMTYANDPTAYYYWVKRS